MILGQLPKRRIIGFVDNKAFNGNHKLNPYNFQHFSINYLPFYVDGVQIPSKSLQPCFIGENQVPIDVIIRSSLAQAYTFSTRVVSIVIITPEDTFLRLLILLQIYRLIVLHIVTLCVQVVYA